MRAVVAVAAAAALPSASAAPLFPLGTPEPSEGWSADFREHFYGVNIRGVSGGIMRNAVSARQVDGEWELRTVEEMEARVDRGADQVLMRLSTMMVENLKGEVLLAGYSQQMAKDSITIHYQFPPPGQGGKVKVKSDRSGTIHHSESDGPAADDHFLGRVAALRHIAASLETCRAGTLEAPETVLRYRTVKPEMGATVTNVMSVLLDVKEGGGMTRWYTAVEGIGLNATEDYAVGPEAVRGLGSAPPTFPEDALAGVVLHRYAAESPFGLLEAFSSTEAEARRRLKEEKQRPELVYSAYVPVERDGRLQPWSDTRSVRYRVSPKVGPLPQVPSRGYQSVSSSCDELDVCSSAEGEVIVTIDLDSPSAATDEDLAQKDTTYSAVSAMLDYTDKAVAALAKQARKEAERKVAGDGPPTFAQLAEASWQVARRTIKLSNLATGFASAAETARTKQGDCSEFAVLLAAILRGVGVPSRAASGLVYLDYASGANFGWHMWTQAMLPYVEKGKTVWRWVDFDATLTHPFSVGHVLLGTSPLSDATAYTEELKLVSMIGNLRVAVAE